ncbi:MAG: Xaa-Pro peptidase family protein, partial [Bacteroidota bacterium]
MSRIDTIRRLAADAGASGAIVTHLADIRWAVGFTGSNGLLVVTPEAAHFVTDGRYDTQAREEVQGAEVHVPGYALWRHVDEAGLLGSTERLAFQSDHVTVDLRQRLGNRFPDVGWVPLASMLVEAVAAKGEREIEAVRQAQALTCGVFESIVPLLQPGISEIDVAAELVYRHLKAGAERMAFEPIVGSGPNGALPHARATSRTLQEGDLVVIDVGCMLDGYASDLTRTVAIGEPGQEARDAYSAVLEAQ